MMIFRSAPGIWFIGFTFLTLTPGSADDWPHFLGPNHDLHSAEKNLDLNFPVEGPKELWEVKRGKGHAGPVVAMGKLVFIHQLGNEEVVQCHNAVTGKKIWEHRYSVVVSQSYGISDAPRSSPVIDVESGLVFTLGNDGDLIAFRLDDGEIIWRKKLRKEFGAAPFFFGQGSCPLPYREKLIVQVGSNDACVVAFNKKDGAVIWKTAHQWNGSYASPVPGKVNGQERVFVFAGGMTKPPHGGLLCINPENGAIDDAIPWRSDMFASVNAASPVPCGENRVFITEDYGKGGAMIQFDSHFKGHIIWNYPEFGCQFQTPIYHEGVIYGLGGNGGLMVAHDVVTGRNLWNEMFYQTTIPWKGREIPISLGHANIIYVDGAFLCLGENGDLLRLKLDGDGYQILAKARLFYAPETWAPPVVSEGRLYVNQNEMGSRLICYDIGAGNKTAAP